MSLPARAGAPSIDVPFELPDWVAQMAPDAALRRLESEAATGLTPERTCSRLARFGPNELEPVRKTSLPRLFWAGAREPFVVPLFVAGCLAIALNEVRDGLLVLVILAPIVGAGVVIEYRGEKARPSKRSSLISIPSTSLTPTR
jgi:magnesium-transporting ATPase (P-type)